MNKDEAWLLQEKYKGKKTEDFVADCARLSNGEPLAYVIGFIPFLRTQIYLDSRPLIPRPETEFWVEKIIFDMQNNAKSNIAILDLCAGSGCIGVAVLSEIENAHVDFAEIEVSHHTTIKKNISENGIDPERTQIFGGDLFEQITDTYDYILTNPPYIDSSLHRTEKSVRTFEPALALYGGEQGTDIIFKIIEATITFLKIDGSLIIEHEPEQNDAIHMCAKTVGFSSTTYTDQYGTSRYTVLTRK